MRQFIMVVDMNKNFSLNFEQRPYFISIVLRFEHSEEHRKLESQRHKNTIHKMHVFLSMAIFFITLQYDPLAQVSVSIVNSK